MMCRQQNRCRESEQESSKVHAHFFMCICLISLKNITEGKEQLPKNLPHETKYFLAKCKRPNFLMRSLSKSKQKHS